MSGYDHFKTGGDQLGAEDVVLADDYVFEALVFPLFGDVFGDFMVVDGTCGMWDGSEVTMLLANFVGGDKFF